MAGRFAVAGSGENCPPGAFERKLIGTVGDVSKCDGPAVTELAAPVPELVTGVAAGERARVWEESST